VCRIGYSDYDVLKKIDRGSRVYRCKKLLRHFCKTCFSILNRFLRIGFFKFQKNPNDLKTFSSQNLKMGIKTTQNLLTKKLQAKEVCKLEFVLFYTTNLEKFLANNFF
jgi:hypothetical protein